MGKTKNLSLRRHLASLVWAVYIALGTTFASFFIDGVVRSLHVGDNITYLLWAVIIAVCCFLIIRYDPKSIWYVPLVSISIFVPAVYAEIRYWGSPNSVSLLVGVILIAVISLLAYRAGRKREIHPPIQARRA